jgi:hypothetical protein
LTGGNKKTPSCQGSFVVSSAKKDLRAGMVVLVAFVILEKKDGIRCHTDAYDGEENPGSHFSPPFSSGKGSRPREPH